MVRSRTRRYRAWHDPQAIAPPMLAFMLLACVFYGLAVVTP